MRILIIEPEGFSEEARRTLESLGSVRTSARLMPYPPEILFVRLKYQWDRKKLSDYPDLKIICSPTTGLDHIDLDYCKERGIIVLSLQGETEFLAKIPATAEHTWGLLLALVRRIPWAFEDVVLNQRWDRDVWKGTELKGKTLGIVGYGRIGRQVASFANAFGMKFLAVDPVLGVEALEFTLRNADVVTLHLPLMVETEGMFGPEKFAQLKKGAYLINTSRGEIIQEEALLAALESGQLAGAALDVIANERGNDFWDNPLLEYALGHRNLLITPHIGGATFESMAATEIFIADKLKRFLEGDLTNDFL